MIQKRYVLTYNSVFVEMHLLVMKQESFGGKYVVQFYAKQILPSYFTISQI